MDAYHPDTLCGTVWDASWPKNPPKRTLFLVKMTRNGVFWLFSPAGWLHMINCTINPTVHIFFLKKSYLSPRCPKLHNFFFLVQFFHNIYLSNGLGVTIGTPSWPKLKKCVKKVLFCLSQICKYLGYPPLGGAFVSKFWP